MGDLRARQRCAEALSAYHPFWLRLGMEVVVGSPVPPPHAVGLNRRAQLDAFVRERFLADPDLARQHAGNRATGSLHPPQYWVRAGVPVQAHVPAKLTLPGGLTCLGRLLTSTNKVQCQACFHLQR